LSTKVTKEHEEKPSSIFVSFMDIFHPTVGERTFIGNSVLPKPPERLF